ncbi:hypothetical protein [Streptomyces turgidiscabies]|uniref:hypothetical protein n=1 Tax=Streptomyces turgidiscabies TaxID=85558 RepID=UPI0005CB6553|nr:hypothetical protein [Streptomyces turgidiscabies]
MDQLSEHMIEINIHVTRIKSLGDVQTSIIEIGQYFEMVNVLSQQSYERLRRRPYLPFVVDVVRPQGTGHLAQQWIGDVQQQLCILIADKHDAAHSIRELVPLGVGCPPFS